MALGWRRRRSRIALSLLLLSPGACGFLTETPTCPQGDGLSATALTGEQLPDRTLVLTFDSETSTAASEIAAVLAAHGAQGAFFVKGAGVADSRDVLAQLKAQGHLVGNRGYRGRDLITSTDPVSEIRKTDELIAPYVSGNIYLLRPPLGRFDAALITRLNDAGLGRYVGPVGWDIGEGLAGLVSDDACWQLGLSVEDCARPYLDAIRAAGKGIVRLHADDARSATLLRELLAKLKTEAFQFLRLDLVPPLRQALEQRNATPGTVGGPAGCQEYGR